MVRKIKFRAKNEKILKKGISLDLIPIRDYNFLEKNMISPMIKTTFKSEGLVGLKTEISEKVIYKIPIIKIIIEFMELLEEEKEIKLTKIGNIPPRFIKKLYKTSVIKNELIESGIRTLRSEDDVEVVKVARVLCEIAKYTKKRKGYISLTQRGKKILKDKYKLFEKIIEIYANEYNWGYLSNLKNEFRLNEILSYILYLLDSGNKYDVSGFTDELIKAFPRLLDDVEIDEFEIFDKKTSLSIGFSITCLKGFLTFFGLVDVKEMLLSTIFVKSDIFDEIISFEKLDSLRKENKKKRVKSNAEGLILYYNKDNILKFEKELNHDIVEKFKRKKKVDLELQIDEMVYDLYELTEEEKEIVRNFKN